MKILQSIGGFGAKGGGTSTCTYDLLSAIDRVKQEGEAVELLTPEVKDPSDKIMGQGEGWIHVVKNDYRTPVAFSHSLTEALKASDADIFHTNGMWMHVNHSTCAIARKKGRPYVITPHGMLYPEAMRRSYWKKWPLIQLWFRKDVMRASAIHVTCETELEHIRNLGYKGPVALIGNPVPLTPEITEIYNLRSSQLSHSTTPQLLHSHTPQLSHSHTLSLGFLGRLHPIKCVERLLQAVALRPEADVRVVLMGTGSADYEQFLRSEAQRLGVADRVEFAGFVSGREKFERLAQLDALFVPSDMENFGMIIPEALLVGTPVMASLGTPWQALNENRCGWWTDNSPESIAAVIDDICSKSPAELFAMGSRGRQFVLDRFEATAVARQMLSLYRWLSGSAPKPDFIYD